MSCIVNSSINSGSAALPTSKICPETNDVGKEEQLSICLRFVNCGVLHEDFNNFVKADALDSRSVMTVLKEQLDAMGVDSASHLIIQCYVWPPGRATSAHA